MIEIRVTGVYKKWVQKLRDSRAKARIRQRIRRLRQGNPGDWKFVGEDVIEMRIDYGPGYRVYYKDTRKAIIILLCGGDKTSQEADIVKAKGLAKEEEEYEDDLENLLEVLGDIARSKGMAIIARELNLNREGLYESLSSKGNPSFFTVVKVLDQLGFKLSIRQKKAS